MFEAAEPNPVPFVFSPPAENEADGGPSLSSAAREALRRATQDPDVLASFPDGVVPYPVATPVAVELDGSTSDWPTGVPWEFVSLGQGVEVGDGDADASFRLAGVAGDEHLFFAARIRDDAKAASDAALLKHGEDDALFLSLQPTDESGAEAGPAFAMTINRHHVVRSSDPDNGIKTPARQYVQNSQGLRAVIMDGADGWTVELSVPLDRLGADAKARPSMLFRANLVDRDEGQEEAKVLHWRRAERLETDGGSPSDPRQGGLRLVPLPGG